MEIKTVKKGERFGILRVDITPAGGWGPVHAEKIFFETDTGKYSGIFVSRLAGQGIEFEKVPCPAHPGQRDLIILADGVIKVE